ncbi:hypothetical protein DPMN_130305 [Dreissena polymorpha]|uniref:Uncharacterized protein n=1 Tax=Dreissena polymorpha TaxID=45954 RepID=A0A9D4K1P9_DREPO|nr:hypothetical protein DPMN_130305 [Dreissena polymorpha]
MPSSDILSAILDRLNAVDKKLSQLDQIQQTVSSIVSRIDKMAQQIPNFESRIKDVEQSCDFSDSAIENLKKDDCVWLNIKIN